MLHYLIQFVLGGAVIVGISLVAKSFGGKHAALVYALPVQFTVAAIIVYLESGNSTVRDLCFGSVFGVMASALFILSLYLLLGILSFWPAIFGAYLVFALAAGLYLKFI